MSAPHVRLVAVTGLLALTFGASPATGMVERETSRDAKSRDSAQPLIGPPSGDDLHVMSTNIRMDFDAQGPPDGWKGRLPILLKLIERERPTLIGAQEVLYKQLKQLRRELPSVYDSIGIGSEGGSNGQFMQIFYDSGRLDPLEFDHFWLSGNPSEIGSTTWGNDEFMRMVTWVRFLDRRTDQEFYHLNTHFDHRSKRAREESARLIRKRIKAFKAGLPVVVTGDFNARAEDSETYDILTGKGALKDAWKTAKKRVTPAYGTFPHYGPLEVGTRRIDWILTRGVTVRSAGHNGFKVKGNYPSDHLPVQAVIEFKS